MKPGEKFTLTSSWWKAGKPALLLKTGISEAIKNYEAADKTYGRDPTPENYVACVKALAEVDKARLNGIAKCGSNSTFKTTKSALESAKAIEAREQYYLDHQLSVLNMKLESLQKFMGPETETADKLHTEATALAKKALQHEIKIRPALKVINEAQPGTKEWLDAKTIQHNEGNPLKEISARLAQMAEEAGKQKFPSLDEAKTLSKSLYSAGQLFKTFADSRMYADSFENLCRNRVENQKKLKVVIAMAGAVKKTATATGL